MAPAASLHCNLLVEVTPSDHPMAVSPFGMPSTRGFKGLGEQGLGEQWGSSSALSSHAKQAHELQAAPRLLLWSCLIVGPLVREAALVAQVSTVIGVVSLE